MRACCVDACHTHTHQRFVRVLDDVAGPEFDTYFAYPEELRNSKRITVFRDFLIQKVQETRF